MCCRLILSALLLGAGLAVAADQADTARIARLISQLGSDRFDEREQATRELEALGPAALAELRKAANSTNLETQQRAEKLVKNLESRLNNEKMLVAARVHFTFKDTPVLEALADIARQTGYNLSYVDDPAPLQGRTVTLNTGATTFWPAFDQFCMKAGLVEVAGQYRAAGPQPVAIQVGGQPPPPVPIPPLRKIVPPNSVNPTFGAYRQVQLTDGKQGPLPTDYVGPVRVRALPPEMQLLGATPRQEKELRVILDLSPEPGVDFVNVLDLRIDKALDDRGQALTAVGGLTANNPVGVALNAAARPLPRQIPVRFEPGTEPTRALKELKGTSMVAMRTPAKVMAIVDDIQNATGKSSKGEHNVKLTVRDVKKHPDGQLELQVLVERPADVLAQNLTSASRGAIAPVQPGQIQIQIRPLPRQLPRAVPPQQVPPAAPPAPAPNPAPNAPAPAPNPAPKAAAPARNRAKKAAQPQAAPQPAQVQPVPVQARIGQLATRTFGTAYVGLAVLDGKDQRLPLTNARSLGGRTINGITTQEVTLTVQPQAGHGEPAKLIFTGMRTVNVEIAFTLKDVPLP